MIKRGRCGHSGVLHHSGHGGNGGGLGRNHVWGGMLLRNCRVNFLRLASRFLRDIDADASGAEGVRRPEVSLQPTRDRALGVHHAVARRDIVVTHRLLRRHARGMGGRYHAAGWRIADSVYLLVVGVMAGIGLWSGPYFGPSAWVSTRNGNEGIRRARARVR